MAEKEWMVSIECTHSKFEPKLFYASIWATPKGLSNFMQNPYRILCAWLQAHGYSDWDPDDSPMVVPHQRERTLCQKCQICMFDKNNGKVLGLPHPDSYSKGIPDPKCFFSMKLLAK